MERRETRGIAWLLALFVLELAVVFSVFSQIDALEQFARPAMYAAWLLVLLMGIVKNRGRIPLRGFTLRFFLAYLLFLGLCVVTGLVDSRHLSANYMRVLLVPLLVTFAGDLYADEDRALWNRIGKLYLVCSVIFAVWVQRTYFPSYASWLKANNYLFAEKNSAAQIWVSAIMISVFLMDHRGAFEKWMIYLACAYLLIMTGISQCRTAILGVAVSLTAFSVSRAQKKGRWILLIALVVLAVWMIPAARQFINQALFLDKYDSADLNTFSSGRIARYQMAFQKIQSSPFIGVGKYYVDCSYILILAESGILGFLFIEWIWLKKIVLCLRYRGDARSRSFLFLMTVFYLVESVLEGYPPFGPGVSSFMFWFLSAMVINGPRRSDSQGSAAGIVGGTGM